MSHERFVEKKGKKFGPYLYESYRDEQGKVRKRYLGSVHDIKRHKSVKLYASFIIIAVLSIVISSYIYLNQDAKIQTLKISSHFYDSLKNSAKTLEGFLVSESESQEEQAGTQEEQAVEQPITDETTTEIEGETQETMQETETQTETTQETTAEIEIQEINENITEETETEEINETIGNIENETISIISNESSNIAINETITNQTTINETIGNIENETISIISNETIINQTVINETLTNETILAGNVTIETKKARIVINRPVKWVKRINIDNITDLEIEIPKEAENISIKTGIEASQAVENINTEEKIIEEDKNALISGNVISEIGKNQGLLIKILRFFKLTGKVISENELNQENSITETDGSKIVDVGSVVDVSQETEIALEYETPAPTAEETNITGGKEVIISAPDELNYTDILAYSELDNSVSIEEKDNIRLYWNNNETGEIKKELVDFDAYDLDEDGNIDYIEWNVPHLSEQVYEIIYITKAEKLDSERNFIEDIYTQVKAKDGNYALIENGNYVRVLFEQNLTFGKDMTIYAKGLGNISVYNENDNMEIGKFDINSENIEEYKIYPNYSNNDIYDLLVSSDSGIEIDYIVDPFIDNSSLVQNLYDCGILNTTDAVYTLNKSITGITEICFNVTANNITINFNGFNLTGAATESVLVGVYILGYNSTTIKNGIISDFGTGIYLSDNVNNSVSNMSLVNSYGYDFFTGGVDLCYDGSGGGTGLCVYSSSNNIFNNITTNSSGDKGIYLDGSSNNIFNDIYSNSDNKGIFLEYILGVLSSENNSFNNINIRSCSDNCIYLNGVSNNTFSSGIINNSASNSIYLYTATSAQDVRNNLFRNLQIANSVGNDVYLNKDASYIILNNTFLNVTYNTSKEVVANGAQLIRKWYYSANVTGGNSAGIENVNVTAVNSSGNYQFNLTSNSQGLTGLATIIDYINTGTRNYYSNYTITATNITYIDSHQKNITQLGNLYYDSFTLSADILAPAVSLVSPANGTSLAQRYINFNISASDISGVSSCLYSLNNGINNFTMSNPSGNNWNATNSSIANGTYTAKFYCNDTSGNLNNSVQTTFILGNLEYLTGAKVLDLPNAYYILNNSITTSGTCFNVTAENITIDFNGKNISGDGAGYDFGVYISGYDNLRVINGSITKFATSCIYAANGENHTISEMNLTYCYGLQMPGGSGIDFISVNNSLIENTVANYNNGSGIYLYDSRNNTLRGNTANFNVAPGGHGIWLNSSSNNTLINNTMKQNTGYDLYILNSMNNIINDSIINGSDIGIYSISSNNSYITGFSIVNSLVGIRLSSSSNNIFKNGNITGTGSEPDVDLESNSLNNTFLNVTYTLSNEDIDSSSQIIRKWYYSAYVNDTNGNVVFGTNITAYNVSNSYQFNLTTNSAGLTGTTTIIDYINTGTRSYYSLYNITAVNSSYSPSLISHSFNASLGNQVDYLSFIISSPSSAGSATSSSGGSSLCLIQNYSDWSPCRGGIKARYEYSTCGRKLIKALCNCTSNWACEDWDECRDEIQNRYCIDLEKCIYKTSYPVYSRKCNETCEENWSCSWSECNENYTIPNCNDLDNCGTEYSKPEKIKCISPILNKTCIPDIKCGEWGECSLNFGLIDLTKDLQETRTTKTRICSDLNNCINPEYETRNCSLAVNINIEKSSSGGAGGNQIKVYDSIKGNLLATLSMPETNLLNIDFEFGGNESIKKTEVVIEESKDNLIDYITSLFSCKSQASPEKMIFCNFSWVLDWIRDIINNFA